MLSNHIIMNHFKIEYKKKKYDKSMYINDKFKIKHVIYN